MILQHPQLSSFNYFSDDRHFYLLTHYAAGGQQQIYQYAANKSLEFLYIETALKDMLEYSPVLIKVDESDPILERFIENNQNQQDWSGILISVAAQTTLLELIAHLRNRMNISFGTQRKGLLHFQNPFVLSYLLAESNSEDNANWLGMIKSMECYDHRFSSAQKQWLLFDNEHANRANLTPEWLLTISQQHALELMFDDKQIQQCFDLLNDKNMHFDVTRIFEYRRWYKQAEIEGMSSQSDIARYFYQQRLVQQEVIVNGNG